MRDSDEWTTTFTGEISGLQIDGQKVSDIHDLSVKVDGQISDIHDLSVKVDGQNKQIRGLAITATTMALFVLFIVSGIGLWLLSHESSIDRVLLTGNRDFDEMQSHASSWRSHKRQRAWVYLQHHQGLYWDDALQDWLPSYANKKPTAQ